MLSAQQLPKIDTDKPNSIVDPQVWVEIHGVSIDKARAKTQRIDNNGEKAGVVDLHIIMLCDWVRS